MSMNPVLAISTVEHPYKHRELMCLLLQEHLDKVSHSRCEQPVCDSDGIDRPNVRSHDRKIETVLGTVSTNRTGYGNEGMASLQPLGCSVKASPLPQGLLRGHAAI